MRPPPLQVTPLGPNYTQFLESNDHSSLASFLQDRLDKYRDCILHLSEHIDHSQSRPNGATTNEQCASCGVDALVDGLIAIHDDTRAVLKTESWGPLPAFWERFEKIVSRLKQLRINKDDFETIKALTRGQYGKVSIVRSRLDGGIYAMKTLNKMYILSQKDKILYMEERHVLAITSEWFPTLYAAFQDEVNLYLVMEYAPGGDLYSILDKKQDELNKTQTPLGEEGAQENGDSGAEEEEEEEEEEDTTLSEDEVRFYIAEIILAVAELHKNQYIHRDLKPQNILLDATGHIMLADFGACARLDDSGQVHGQTVPLGTWDYMSPEVVDAQSAGSPYGKEVDWWAVGVITYELLVGEPPFFAESAMGIIRLLRDHENNLSFDKAPDLGVECKDLIKRFDDDLDGSDETVQDKQSTVVDYRGGQLRRFEGYNLAFIGYTYQTFIDLLNSPTRAALSSGLADSLFEDSVVTKLKKEPSMTGLDKEDIGRMRMEQEILRLASDLENKSKHLEELEAIHQTLVAQYNGHLSQASETEAELSSKMVGLAASSKRERVEAEEAMQELKGNLELITKKVQQLETENESMRTRCGELEHEVETQRESILKQQIEEGKVSLLRAENEELRNQKEHDRLRENQLFLAEMERANRLREENEALKVQIRDLERQDEQTSKEHRSAVMELKKAHRGTQGELAEQANARKRLEEDLRQQTEAKEKSLTALGKASEQLEQKDVEILQLTKACEVAVVAMDSTSTTATNGGSVRTIYPSMLKRERASNKVLIQQLEEQGEKIADLESKIRLLEQEKSRHQVMRSPDRVASPIQPIWPNEMQQLSSPTKLMMELSSPDDVSGWIRVSWPLAEKKPGKYTWKKQYVILRDMKIFAMDREGDPLVVPGSRLLADLRSNVGTASTTSTFSTATTETSMSYQGSVSSPTQSTSMMTRSRSELMARIETLKLEIQKEGQIKRGAESIQAAWIGAKGSNDTYLKSKESVDACIKNIKDMETEVGRLSVILSNFESNGESPQEPPSAERNTKAKDIEKLIMIERQHLEAAEKMAAPLMNATNNPLRRNWKSAVEVQIESSKQKLATLVLELEKLNATWTQQRDIYGHSFHLKHYTYPKSCHHCHDVLWGSQKTGYECNVCKFVAHRQCLDLMTISCQEQQGLRHSIPIYLLAHDKHEQRRWIRTIELHRKRAEAVVMAASTASEHGADSSDNKSQSDII
ncbi:Rho-associated protein kinase 2 [Lunasporangiospora selenospora]|uniref:non-specific serine/threonine protein kinase n=1 Tax=Lunasporangiospora selenospora TaxID=979761 RepID=A0A9P6FUU8_9FUNG|nr:Rho-associated protein kinase 2 [Lunasporangiospora selenospora]